MLVSEDAVEAETVTGEPTAPPVKSKKFTALAVCSMRTCVAEVEFVENLIAPVPFEARYNATFASEPCAEIVGTEPVAAPVTCT